MNFLKISAYALVGALLAAPIPHADWTALAYAASSDDADSITVQTAGTGVDEDKAMRQALKNAVMQAVGGIVDAETVSKNDEIIKDQILTASTAIVTKVERVGKPRVEDGLVTVQIRAVVQKKLLVTRLQDAKVMAVAKVDGESMWAKMATELENEKDAGKIVERVFKGTATAFIKAEVFGKPEVVGKKDGKVLVRTKFQFSMDEKKYAEWKKAAEPLLERIALKCADGSKCVTITKKDQRDQFGNQQDGTLYRTHIDKNWLESPLCVFVRNGTGDKSYPKIYSLPISSDVALSIVKSGTQMPIMSIDYLADGGEHVSEKIEYPLGFRIKGLNGDKSDIQNYITCCYKFGGYGRKGFMNFYRKQEAKAAIEGVKFTYDDADFRDAWKSHPESIGLENALLVGMLAGGEDENILYTHFSPRPLILQHDILLDEDSLKKLKEVRIALRNYSIFSNENKEFFEHVDADKVLVLDMHDKDAMNEKNKADGGDSSTPSGEETKKNWFQRNLQKDGASSPPASKTSPFAPAVPSFRLRK